MVFDDRLEDFVVQNVSVKAVRALQDHVPCVQGFGRDVVMAHRLVADAAGQRGAVRAGHGIALQQQAQFHLQGGVRMVGGQPLDLPAANQIGPRIPDMSDGDLVVAEKRGQQRRGHATRPAGPPGRPGRPTHRISARSERGGGFRLGFLETDNAVSTARRLALSPLPSPPTPSATMAMLPTCCSALKVLRLPEKQKILVVVANGPGAGELVAFDFHFLVLTLTLTRFNRGKEAAGTRR